MAKRALKLVQNALFAMITGEKKWAARGSNPEPAD
jgi:hypothetical protein